METGMKTKQIGYYDYTVILTYAGMILSFYGVLRVLERDFHSAVICLMLAGVCDMFDGTVANTKKRDMEERRFGVQIDSLSDLVSFGVFPALFIYVLTENNPIAGGVGALFVLAALIRLAYFNVLEEKRQLSTTESPAKYIGVPVTTIAVTLPVFYILYDASLFRTYAPLTGILLLSAISFLAPIEIRKPKVIGKICLIFLGLLEAITVVLFMGWDVL